MPDESAASATPTPVASTPVFLATFAAVLALIAAFLFLDLTLGRIDRNESRIHAADLYQEGRSLLASGHPHEASDRFASALAIERTNTSYALGLAQALMDDGHSGDAEQTLLGALDRSANDGEVNLLMARLLARTGRTADAVVYYHRAIFGRWGADSAARRIQTRFELVNVLARRNDGGAMLAELLPLEATLPDSPSVRRRLAHLFLQAGSPRRAMDILRDFIRQDPKDADAYAGMAEAAMALGNFATARADFAQAALLQPDNAAAVARQALADTVAMLDPEARRLDEGERSARARSLLARAVAERERCAGAPYTGATADSARAALAAAPAFGTSESTDATTRLAVAIWSSRPRCVTSFAPDEVLGAIMRSLEP